MDKKKASLNLDNRTIEFVNKLRPEVRVLFTNFLLDCQRKGFEVYVWSSTRTYQEALHIWNKYPEVRANVRCVGCDYHFFGFAVDVTFKKNGITYNQNTSKQVWLNSGLITIADKYGLNWGGNFGYHDPVHFDKRLYTIQYMEQCAISQFGTLEGTDLKKLEL